MTTYEERPDIAFRTADRPAETAGADVEPHGGGGHGRVAGQQPGPTRGGRSARRPRRVIHAPSPADRMADPPADPFAAGASSADTGPTVGGPIGVDDRREPVGPAGVGGFDALRRTPGDESACRASVPRTPAGECEVGEADLGAVRTALAAAGSCRASLLMVADHRTDRPRVFTAPVDLAFAGQLLDLALEVADQAAAAEWRPACPGFAPSSGQWLWTPAADTALATLDEEVRRPTHPPYQRSVDFGRSNLLVLRVRADDGDDVLRLYQGFSPDRALGTGRRLVAFWSGERFSGLTEPLVVDRSFRVLVAHGVAVMPTAASYEGLFGPPAVLRAEAAAIFTEAFEDSLTVRGIDELRAACLSDLNMMRKLVSIRRRLADPRFRAALTMDRILAFLAMNPQVTVPVDRSGPSPALVFEPGPQQRWALLKLLDDDFLRSDLTDYRYEANSKSEVR